MSEYGKLSVVGTPIGNFSDFSPRGVETLGNADFIACEDGGAAVLRNTDLTYTEEYSKIYE